MLSQSAFARTASSFLRQEPTVFIVTGDPLVSRVLQAALKSDRVRIEPHGSVFGFLKTCDPQRPGCLVWDAGVPGLSDRELMVQLERQKIRLPVIFISDSADTASVVRALKAGVLNYLDKPLERQSLWEAIHEALAIDADNRARRRRSARIRQRVEQLTPGEKEVLAALLEGSSNRQIADALGRSVRTIEERRAKLMKKMRARNLPELVRMVMAAENGSVCRLSLRESDGTFAERKAT